MLSRRAISRVFQRHNGLFKIQVRRLSLLEYHSHKLLKDFDIPVPQGYVVESPEQAREVVSKISGSPWRLIPATGFMLEARPDSFCIADPHADAPSVVKAQILAGGRGKGKYESDGKGGVRIMTSPIEAFENASRMIGYYLTTKQTPPGGLLVKKLYIYKAVDVAQEYYIALTFDRDRGMPVLLISNVGGVDIESNADKLEHYWFDMTHGITSEITAYIQAQLGFSDSEIGTISHILHQMVKLFKEKDATLLELNPLVRTPKGHFVCLDAKFTFDNSARFRQPEIFSLEERLPDEEDEYEASQAGLSYVRLDGNIGNIVNGAGLAMATNDLVSLFGGKCANFLDVGGGATRETVAKAFEILNRDSRIKGILVNIYGGIVRCDMIADSIIAAAAATKGFKVPVVVRLQGTNCDNGLGMIERSGLQNLIVEPDFELAAEKIVAVTSKSV